MTASRPADEVASRLLDYLRDAVDSSIGGYDLEPRRFSAGVENRVYGFRLRGAPPGLSGDLVLRLYPPHAPSTRAVIESTVQNDVAASGYPAPRALHVCTDPAPLGAPFLVLERLAGRTMLEPLAATNPPLWRVVLLARQVLFRMPEAIASLAAALHRLDPQQAAIHLDEAGLLSEVAGVDARLARVGARVESAGLASFGAALDWLAAHRPPEPGHRSLCHGDLWFGNLLEDGQRRITGVLDWSADMLHIGDPMYDVGVISAGLQCGMVDVPGPMRSVVRGLQRSIVRRFLAAYRRQLPVDAAAMRYYELYRCVDYLSWVAERRVVASRRSREGRDMLDIKGATEGFVRYFGAATGIAIDVPPAPF